MKARNKNNKYIHLEEILFEVNREQIGQKHYVELICKKKDDIFYSLCEMCPNTKFFLVRIFPHSD